MVAALVTLSLGVPAPQNDGTEVAKGSDDLQNRATEFLNRVDKLYAEWNNKQTLADWEYASNLTPENLAKKLNVSSEAARVTKSIWKEVNDFPWRSIKDENIKRQFSKLSVLGTAALPEDVRNFNYNSEHI